MIIADFSQDSIGSDPDVSVIIPTYNRMAMLEEALASVLSQQFDGIIEVIVIDDNSRDRTSEIIRQKYSFVHLISLKQNVGAGAARNQALLKARGKYIAFLDSDDLWQPNHLKSQITAIEANSRCFGISDLVIWDLERDCKHLKLQQPDLKKYNSPIHHLFVSTFIYTLSSVVIPRQALNEVGLFDETFKLGSEDCDLYIRCLLCGYSPVYTKLITVTKRKHTQGQITDTKNFKLKKKYRFIRISKNYALAKERFEIAPIRQIYAEVHAVLASQYFENNDFFHWFISFMATVHYSSLKYALLSTVSNIKHRKYCQIATNLVKLPKKNNYSNPK
ncbi:glycosyltransferase family 2 protein [Chroogloeocystis siderophila]|jgi:glycosyltransferase involved in cell wall biosynthesis|uniref:Glycosyltransferase 2-like domain-containing protein n=1 Tax=Chroogloeocystis siderophila 5.2 s.c.1 TaxID=247279 RepID=A0A1U7HSC9_9CHRO|nr:glycosyltransferase family 2 protein [Chroogloeocystis siderophila]OKH26448.1 hypothetical protein NIES1031_11975 [Chroogloeocystis siderophila 5.2 s.c.1]